MLLNTSSMRSLSLAAGLAVLLAACGSPPKPPVLPVPAVSEPVPGSAPGPVYGQGPAGAAPTTTWSAQMEDTEKALAAALQGSSATLAKTTDERLWITLPGDLSFESNRSALKPAARTLLDKIAIALRTKLPNAELRIVGHTDAKGVAAANDALSLDRAASTRDWLVARGQLPSRISVAGRGSRDALASNSDETGRATNRRVEILIGDKSKVGTQSAK